MTEMSVTVTVGEGSEAHNHDLEYRSTLKHVHDRSDGVVELIPYRNYNTVINEAVKPYIDRYNQRVEERYQAAWDRYNAGEIKTKPRKRDYRKMSYEYTAEVFGEKYRNPHTGKVEEAPMFRSIIVGIGDKEDRQSGRITEAQAKEIFRTVTAEFKEKFPDFLLLGASLHLDEEGFYHTHIDYKPLYEKTLPDAEQGQKRRGLDVGTGQEAALEHMGFKPEQSIINGRDKAPLLFNAFRNEIYRMMESAMAEQGLRLQYGVSARKDPEKDSSRNQKLEVWQATQDAAREMQHKKNLALEIVSQDKVSPEGFKAAMAAVADLNDTLQKVQESPQTALRNGYKITFTLFDQLKSMVRSVQETIGHLLRKLDQAMADVELYKPFKEKFEKLEAKHTTLESEHNELERRFSALGEAAKSLLKERDELKAKVELRDQFLEQAYYSGNNMLDTVREIEAAEERKKRQKVQAAEDPTAQMKNSVLWENDSRLAALESWGRDTTKYRAMLDTLLKEGKIPVLYQDGERIRVTHFVTPSKAVALMEQTKGQIQARSQERTMDEVKAEICNIRNNQPQQQPQLGKQKKAKEKDLGD